MNFQKTSTVVLFLFILFLVLPGAVKAQDGARLFIKTNQQNVSIRILNYPVAFNQGIKLKPGTYLIRVSKQGYAPQTKKVILTETGEVTLSVDLQPEHPQQSVKKETSQNIAEPEKNEPAEAPKDTGRLFVQADPPDATIRILRIKPVFKQGIELEPGNYLVELNKEGYATKKREVTIKKGKDTTVEIALFLKADMGKLYVNTDPMDANVRLPRIKPKYEPGMELSPGDYTVEISKVGYKTVTRDVNIVDGKIKRLNVTLKPLSKDDKAEAETPAKQEEPSPPPQIGTLTVTVTPADSAVRILDIDKSYTPGMELESGFYVVEARKKGYLTGSSKIAIKPDASATISITLAPEPGQELAAEAEKTLEKPAAEQKPAAEKKTTDTKDADEIHPGKERLYVDTVPADASVRVLNIGPEFTQGLELGPGKYEVEVKKKGLGKIVDTVEVFPGKHAHITIDLTRSQEQPAKETPPRQTGSLIVNTNLINPEIRIDGKPGFGPEITLAPGKYAVEVTGNEPGKDKTTTRKLSVMISAGKTTTLEVIIVPEKKIEPQTAQKEVVKSPAAPPESKEQPAAKVEPAQSSDVTELRELAVAAIKKKQYDKALQLLKHALNQGSPEAATYILLGDVSLLTADNKKALDAYTQAITLAPELAAAYAARGEVYVRLNDAESACYDFWKSCSLGKCREIGLAKKNGVCR